LGLTSNWKRIPNELRRLFGHQMNMYRRPQIAAQKSHPMWKEPLPSPKPKHVRVAKEAIKFKEHHTSIFE